MLSSPNLGYEVFIALRYLRAKRKQTFVSLITFISTLGVGMGTAALVIALALMTGFEEDIRARIFGGSAHVQVLRLKGGPDIGSEEVLRATLEEIRATPGVEAASPIAQGFGLLSGGTTAEKVELLGVDADAAGRSVAAPGRMVSGGFEALDAWGGEEPVAPIVLGEDLAKALHVATGDRIQATLVAPRLTPWGVLPKTFWFEVAGVIDAGFFEYNSARAWIPRRLAIRLFRIEGASWISARVEDPSRIEPVEEALRARLGGEWFVDDLLAQNRSLLAALKWEKMTLFIAISLIVLVGALNIVSTLILLVMEKVRDIGALVAQGATSRGIMILFLLQGLVIGLVGTGAGLLVGVVTANVLDTWQVIRLDPDVYYISHVPFQVRPLDAAGVALMSVGISFLATLYPSWKASRLDPVQALRYE